MAVHRTRDKGATSTRLAKGLPGRNAFLNTMRDGMSADTLDPCGVYVGANTGLLYCSSDEGDSWRRVPALFPPIASVEAVTLA